MDCPSSHIIDCLSSVVGAVAQKQLQALQVANPDILNISFMYGSSNEMIETIAQKDKSPDERFNIWPAFLLFLDLSDDVSDKPGAYPIYTLQMAIAMPTVPTYKASERYEKIFEPILYPLWHEFITQILEAGCFANYSEMDLQYTKYDRPYWGKQGNSLAEVVDAIEFQNLKLRLLPDAKPRAIEPVADFFDDDFFNVQFFR